MIFHFQTEGTFVIEWHTRFVTAKHSVALSGNLNFHACLLLLLSLFVVVKKCSIFKLTKRLITILVRWHFCGFAFLWNLICVSHCYGFTLSWITKLEESNLNTNAPFTKKKVGRETLSPIIIITLFFWREGNALMKCTNEKWKLKKILIFWRIVKRSNDKFALEKFITVFFAARSSQEKPSERRFWGFKNLELRT